MLVSGFGQEIPVDCSFKVQPDLLARFGIYHGTRTKLQQLEFPAVGTSGCRC